MANVDRIWQLHRLLKQRHYGASVGELCEELRTSKSTVNRALKFYRERLGAPLRLDPETQRHRLDPEQAFELPGLWFSPQELIALLMLGQLLRDEPQGLLAETLRPAEQRLQELLRKSRSGAPDWVRRLRVLRMGARSAGEHFVALVDALARRKRVAIEYHARGDDRMSQRIVSPQRLVHYRDCWYLDAWCHTRKALRSFRLDRIIAADVHATRAEDRPDAELDRQLTTSYGIFSGAPTAVAILHFTPQAARWVKDERWHPEQQDQMHGDGSLTRHVPYHQHHELAMDILRHGADVAVLGPDALRAEIRRRLERALVQYGGTAAAGAKAAPANAARQTVGSRRRF